MMKKLLGIFAAVAMTSCTMTENIRITDTGAGHYSVEMDGSQMMAMIPEDKMSEGGEVKDIDSTIIFKDVLVAMKDSIAKLSPEEQQRMKQLEDFTMNIKMKMAEKKMMFTMASDFKDMTQLSDMMKSMEDAQKQGMKGIGPDKADKLGGGFGAKADIAYKFDGKKFSRKVSVPKDAVAATPDSLKMYDMIYESSRYIVKYHFPKRVKKVSEKNALYSEDRKVVTIEYPMGDYVKNPQLSNIEVEFE